MAAGSLVSTVLSAFTNHAPRAQGPGRQLQATACSACSTSACSNKFNKPGIILININITLIKMATTVIIGRAPALPALPLPTPLYWQHYHNDYDTFDNIFLKFLQD